MKTRNPLTSLRHVLQCPCPAMSILLYKLTSQQLQVYTVIIKSLPMTVALLGLTLISYLPNIIVGSSTSAVIDSILNSDGVSITSVLFDLYSISRHDYGRKCMSCRILRSLSATLFSLFLVFPSQCVIPHSQPRLYCAHSHYMGPTESCPIRSEPWVISKVFWQHMEDTSC